MDYSKCKLNRTPESLKASDKLSRFGNSSTLLLFLSGPCSESGHGRTQCSSYCMGL
jgi:hypothetical protein